MASFLQDSQRLEAQIAAHGGGGNPPPRWRLDQSVRDTTAERQKAALGRLAGAVQQQLGGRGAGRAGPQAIQPGEVLARWVGGWGGRATIPFLPVVVLLR
jgi:hypothetical protein